MKFVSFHDSARYAEEKRVFSPATAAVVDYLANIAVQLGEKAEIVSAAETRHESGFYPFRSESIREGVTLTQASSRGHRNPLLRELGKIRNRLWLTWYLMKTCDANETVFFVDSPVLYEPLLLFRLWAKYRNIEILYFASEIFQEIIPMSPLKKKMEWYLFEKAEKLIVSTELLNQKINPTNRPYAILNGTYQVMPEYGEQFEDDFIHLVYAGVINSTKGSGQAVGLAAHLPERYKIHILGFGEDEDVQQLKESIEQSNRQNLCQVVYEGILSGDDYSRFLQKCHLGLCPQNLNEAYNDSSFPSKILSYLSNGLRVLSVDLPAIRTSQVGDLLYFSTSDQPKDLAEAVQAIDWSQPYDSRHYIQQMHQEFVEAFRKLM